LIGFGERLLTDPEIGGCAAIKQGVQLILISARRI
jgi:hypothetical protein